MTTDAIFPLSSANSSIGLLIQVESVPNWNCCYGNIGWTWYKLCGCWSQEEAVGSEEKTLHDSKLKKKPSKDANSAVEHYQLAPHSIDIVWICAIASSQSH